VTLSFPFPSAYPSLSSRWPQRLLIKPSLYLRPTSSDSTPIRPALCDTSVYLYQLLELKGRSLSHFLLPSSLLASVIASTSGTIFLPPRISLIRGSRSGKLERAQTMKNMNTTRRREEHAGI
jgi:hypothetical protein